MEKHIYLFINKRFFYLYNVFAYLVILNSFVHLYQVFFYIYFIYLLFPFLIRNLKKLLKIVRTCNLAI